MAVTETTHVDVSARPAQPGDRQRWSPAISYWAVVGGLMLAFMAYVLIRWVTGPYFKTVEAGPTQQPGWMDTIQAIYLPLGIGIWLTILFFTVVRPLRRERRLTTDGLLSIAFITLYFQDPLSNYGQYWFIYNANLPNMGSWANDVPGWLAPGDPGAMWAETPLFMGLGYLYFCWATVLMSNVSMRKARERWPGIRTEGLIAVSLVTVFLVDVVIEGIFWMPLGFFAYPGAPGPTLFSGTYHQFPLIEAAMVSVGFTGLGCLRFFRDDRGNTLVERGAEQLRVSTRRKTVVRLLAMVAGVNLTFGVLYNVPAYWVGTHAATWPAEVQKRSYFTNHVCGAGTDRACPGTTVPIPRDDGHSSRVTPDGRLALPENGQLPKLVPFCKSC